MMQVQSKGLGRAVLSSGPSSPSMAVSLRKYGASVNGARGVRVAAASVVDELQGVRPEILSVIEQAVPKCLNDTQLSVGKYKKGKVRDTYELEDKMIIITTDRQSAFDRHLASIPFKGQVLNQTAAWWFENTTHIVPNAVVSVPDPNVTIMKKCKVFPVEFVCRGFMTGSTDTSLWTHYKAGEREYCGNTFPDGMVKNDRLPSNVITPTTKADDHDVPISPKEIVEKGLMSQADWDMVSAAALGLFNFGQQQAQQRGLLLVDTKYEFGEDEDGQIRLIDEIHTPDSSRYWIGDSYEARHAQGLEPENIDKEFLRLWFRERCDPYKDATLPEAPKELVMELSKRYVFLYEKITGKQFQPPDLSVPLNQRMDAAVRVALGM
ncbi:hypothetical protein DUNSADRAFT_6748 [Dunaliella salina]|uniref:phosphoribosylaminoimidazolesuccinocarboxamide synthase n=1 Tax=Dunaliella salina TaxID=3046 RepID=A0ABQ7H6M0_DUNSA|nr:hypothetical protein DUNSADRAFT_6748 [Dunaliella salina]|eukprot:KAF5842504.1 hypothetical protein DUNSADRAFT_6748 [Dunaliella salina]